MQAVLHSCVCAEGGFGECAANESTTYAGLATASISTTRHYYSAHSATQHRSAPLRTAHARPAMASVTGLGLYPTTSRRRSHTDNQHQSAHSTTQPHETPSSTQHH